MKLIDSELIPAGANWSERIVQLRGLLEQAQNELIEAEAGRLERLKALNEFDFQVRLQLGRFMQRLQTVEQEIRQLRRQLRNLEEDWPFPEQLDDPEAWLRERGDKFNVGDYFKEQAKTKAEENPPPATPLSQEQKAEIKQLYRQLARRFHPDLAQDETDRAYRTEVMAAVNGAYRAGDLEQLRQLLLRPEASPHPQSAHNDQQLAQALLQEIARCQHRLQEIGQELSKLEKGESYRFYRRYLQAKKSGRDLLLEMARQLKEEINHKLVECDILKTQIAEFGQDKEKFDDHLADELYLFNLDHIFDDDLSPEIERWLDKKRSRLRPAEWDEDNPDE